MPKKTTKVTRKFLLDLARTIYDSKNRTFLRLCNGTLQNGPDPTNKKRSMHCGLGELYFAMTGVQPKKGKVSEDDVVDLAVKLSVLPKMKEIEAREARARVKALKVSKSIKDQFLDVIEQHDDGSTTTEEEAFREALAAIPDINDDGCGDETCTVPTYRDRSKRVAAQLRAAAKFLPA